MGEQVLVSNKSESYPVKVTHTLRNDLFLTIGAHMHTVMLLDDKFCFYCFLVPVLVIMFVMQIIQLIPTTYFMYIFEINSFLIRLFLRLLVTGRKAVGNLNMEGGFTHRQRKGEHTI